MKKKLALFSALILLCAIVIGGVVWFLFRPSSRVIAECLPANTVFYAQFPNLNKTYLRYQSSDLKKVLTSQEVIAVSALVGSKIQSVAKGYLSDSDVEQLRKMQEGLLSSVGGETFVALTDADMEKGETGILIGSRPIGGSDAFKKFLQDMGAFLKNKGVALPSGMGESGNVPYQWYGESRSKIRICFASFDGWNVISIGEENLRKFLEAYKNPKFKEASLSSNVDYQYILSQFDKTQDFLAYWNIEESSKLFLSFLGKANAMSQQNPGAGIPAAKVPDFEKLEGFFRKYFSTFRGAGIGMRFNKEKLAERWVVAGRDSAASQKIFSIYKPTGLKTSKFTSYDTLFYYSVGLDLKKYWDYLSDVYAGMGVSVDEVRSQIQQSFAAAGLDFERNVIDALGEEYGFQIDWPKDSAIPNVALYIEVRDAEKFKPAREFMEKVIPQVATAMGGLTISEKNDGTTKLLSTSVPSFPYVSPTLTFDNQFISLQLLESGAVQNLHRPANESVVTRDILKEFAGKKHDPYIKVVYCDTPALIDKAYAELRNFGLKSPLITGISPIPASKWPEKLSFTQPLGQVYWTIRIKEPYTLIADMESGAGSQIIPAYALLLGGSTYWALVQSQHTKAATPAP